MEGMMDYQHSAAIMQEAQIAYGRMAEPSAIYKPSLHIDGNQWVALYGEDLQNGVAGFGDSPDLAMDDFNKNWYRKLNIKKEV